MTANATTTTSSTWLPGMSVELLPPGFTAIYCGWPYTFWTRYEKASYKHEQIFKDCLYVDIVIGVLLLVATGITWERWIKRKDRQKLE
jgi:hypothetical protein